MDKLLENCVSFYTVPDALPTATYNIKSRSYNVCDHLGYPEQTISLLAQAVECLIILCTRSVDTENSACKSEESGVVRVI